MQVSQKSRCSTASVRTARPISIRATLRPVSSSTPAAAQPKAQPALAVASVAAACMLVLMPLQPAEAAPQESSPATQNAGGFFSKLFGGGKSTPITAPPPAVKTGVSRGIFGAPSGSGGEPASTTNAQPVPALSKLLKDVEGPSVGAIKNPIKQLEKDAKKNEAVLQQRVGNAKDSGKVDAPAPPGV